MFCCEHELHSIPDNPVFVILFLQMTNDALKRVELLAPGGDFLSVKAAILAGADAVFLGLGEFNARKRAVNITLKELQEICGIAGQRDVRIYLTLNILAVEREFQDLVALLNNAVEAGIDAVILQDYGLLHTIRRMHPSLEIHASTQMTTHNRGQLELLAKAGVSQVNLSRELSLGEIESISAEAHRLGLKVEVFIHGAYCVSFSGQCYMSGNLYENSANRGACVQPCRREYTRETRRIRPLNLKDNSVFSHAADLIAAGADSFKIEGRIKGYEYVFNTTSAWRDQLNRLASTDMPLLSDSRLEGVFNRSFSDNLIRGRLGTDSFTAESNDSSLKLMDSVVSYSADRKELSLQDGNSVKEGGQITIKTVDGDFICTGFLEKALSASVFRLRIDHVLKGRIQRGQQIWAQPLAAGGFQLAQSIENLTWHKEKLPLNYSLSGSSGTPLVLTASSGRKKASVSSEEPLAMAETRPTAPDAVRKQLSRLGDSPFFFNECDLSDLEEGLFIPVKLLNQMRRSVVALLDPGDSRHNAAVLPIIKSQMDPCSSGLALLLDDPALLADIPAGVNIKTLFHLPADPDVLNKVESLFMRHACLIPWFSSILIGEQFEAACQFLDRHPFVEIVTDNSGIAWYASERGIPWVAGPLLNGSNGYGLEFFQQHGAAGAFLSSELSEKQVSFTTVPEGMQIWSVLISPVLLMKTRHCIVRNCTFCGKEVMDSTCIPCCDKSVEIKDSQGNSILVVKKPGDYNALYRRNPVLNLHAQDGRPPGITLLDLRNPASQILEEIQLKELIELALQVLSPPDNLTELSGVELLLKKIPSLSRRIAGGLE